MLTDLKRTLVEATVSLTVGVAVPGHARDRAGALPSHFALFGPPYRAHGCSRTEARPRSAP